jgi:NhaP-type Na+/H+ or K+/H+ antiporter
MFTPRFLRKYFNHKKITEELSLFFLITSESAFLVKTFFFLVFGFSISIFSLGNMEIFSLGLGVTVILVLIRFIYLRSTTKSGIKPEVFVAPRGLITILLFLSIPDKFKVEQLNENFVLIVILITLVILAFAAPLNAEPGKEDKNLLNE